MQAFDEDGYVVHDFSFVASKNVMVCVGNADNLHMRNLRFESLHLILHGASECRRMGDIEDCQHRKIDPGIRPLAIKNRHTDGIVYRIGLGICERSSFRC